MWHKLPFILMLLCAVEYIRADAKAGADAKPVAKSDAKADAKPGGVLGGSHGCPTGMNPCSNGMCLPEKWFCDGDKDCPWGEDETNCGGHLPWQPSEPKPKFPWNNPPIPSEPFPQPEPQPQREPIVWQPQPQPPQPQPEPQPWRQPIQPYPLPTASPIFTTPRGWINPNPVACPPNSFRCGSSCLPLAFKCNGISDCSDGSDERNCPIIQTISPVEVPTCAADEVQCYSGNCIKITKLCDGFVDCRHYEDEFACSFIKNREYAFRCIEQCIGILRPNCSSSTVDPITPPPTLPPTVRPSIRFCDPGFTLIYDRCIQVAVFPPLDWQSANAASRAYNSRLVEIDNGDFFLQLQAFLNQSKYESYSYWTGANDIAREGHWIWSVSQKNVHLGAPLWSIAREGNTYQQQPNGGRSENCGLLEDCPFQYMNDEICEKKYPYICQRPAKIKYL